MVLFVCESFFQQFSLRVVLRFTAEARIQKGCQRLSSPNGGSSEAGAAGGQYTGVLGQLMEKGQLSLDLIKANVTELMAGGVDTVRGWIPAERILVGGEGRVMSGALRALCCILCLSTCFHLAQCQ